MTSERKRIEGAGGRVIINRINGSLAVSRALGDFDYKANHSQGTFFSKISHFLEQVLMEHEDVKSSLDSKLQVYSNCSVRIRSRK